MTSSQVSPAWASAGRAVSWAKVWLTRRKVPSRSHTAKATGAVSRTAANRFDDVCWVGCSEIALSCVSRTAALRCRPPAFGPPRCVFDGTTHTGDLPTRRRRLHTLRTPYG